MNTRNQVVNEISKINFQGNITPKNWYKNLVNEKGKPNLKAITILGEVVYWYRASEKRFENSSQIKYAVKFHADKLQLSYERLEDDFGFTKEESRAAIEFLEEKKLLTREFRTIKTNGGVRNNVMYLEPNPEMINKITFNEPPLSENSDETNEKFPTTLIGKFPLPSLENSNDNTEITTKITTQTTTINKDTQPYPSQSKIDLFKKHHETKLGRKDDIYQLEILASRLEYSIELYDKVLNAKQNSTWDVRRNQPNTAKWLVATLDNEPLEKKVIPIVKRKTYSAEEYEEVKKRYATKN